MNDPFERLRMPVVPIEPRAEFAEALLRRLEGTGRPPAHDTATVRYFVDDLDAAVAFYRDLLGFEVELRPAPSFAMLYRGDLRLLLSVPGDPHVLPEGRLPRPGGDNRISLLVDDLPAAVAALRGAGARVRGEVTSGVTVDSVLLADPAGNPVELIEPHGGYHEREPRRPAGPPTTSKEQPR